MSPPRRTHVRRPVATQALRGAALALAADRAARALDRGGRLARTNHRGRAVSLSEGPAVAVAAAASAGTAPVAALVAGLGAGALGVYDDLAGAAQPVAKGFRGHLSSLRHGRVTTGVVKLVGIPTVAVVASSLARPPGHRAGAGVLLDAAVVAASANVLNLLDLRPGRALKVGALGAAALRLPGPLAAAAVALPGDLREQTMLGDSGANAYGALLGLALVQRAGLRGRLLALAGLAWLSAASEVVSFSRVIDATPALRWLDRLGRLP